MGCCIAHHGVHVQPTSLQASGGSDLNNMASMDVLLPVCDLGDELGFLNDAGSVYPEALAVVDWAPSAQNGECSTEGLNAGFGLLAGAMDSTLSCLAEEEVWATVVQEPQRERRNVAPVAGKGDSKDGHKGINLAELTKASHKALVSAAQNNQLAVSMFKTPVQPGAWQGCTMSAWCNLACGHGEPCNASATIPGVAAYADLNDSLRDDESGACEMESEEEVVPPGQADSSAACSGRHASSATHHHDNDQGDAEHTSSIDCQEPALHSGLLTAGSDGSGCDVQPLRRSISSGSVPASEHNDNLVQASNQQTGAAVQLPAIKTELPIGVQTTSNPSAQPELQITRQGTHRTLIPVSTQMGVVETSTGNGFVKAQTDVSDVPLIGGQKLADITCINSTWQHTSAKPEGESPSSMSGLPSSFIMLKDPVSDWGTDLEGTDLEGQDTMMGIAATTNGMDNSMAWQPTSNLVHQQGRKTPRTATHAAAATNANKRRMLRTTKSMPNFKCMAMGLDPSTVPARQGSGHAAPPPPPRLIIHRWPSNSSGPSHNRKSKAQEELGRASSISRNSMQIPNASALPGSGMLSAAGSTASIGDLGNTSDPNRTAELVQQLAQTVAGMTEEAGKQGGSASSAAAKHNHNLRDRAPHQQAPRDATDLPPLRISRLPEVPPPQTHGGRKRGASGGVGSTCARPVPHPTGNCCTACGTTVTPVWRAGPQGPKTLCNACGVRYMKVAKRK